jgi:hypothetical protein
MTERVTSRMREDTLTVIRLHLYTAIYTEIIRHSGWQAMPGKVNGTRIEYRTVETYAIYGGGSRDILVEIVADGQVIRRLWKWLAGGGAELDRRARRRL